MKLTGKCEEDFLKHISFNHGLDENDFELQKQVFLNSLIIEFFDSVKYEGKPLFEYSFDFFWKYKIQSKGFNDVCIQAIEKANELYNQNKL